MARSGGGRSRREAAGTQEAPGTTATSAVPDADAAEDAPPGGTVEAGAEGDEGADAGEVGDAGGVGRVGRVGRTDDDEAPTRLSDLTGVLLARAAHPRQAVVTAVGLSVAAALSGRPGREVLLVLTTVLVGQVALGWFNDLVDRRRDARHQRPDKPLVGGRLDPGTLWFSLAIAVFAVVPLSFANGAQAGTAYLVSLGIALAATWTLGLRRGAFSWAPWAASFALYPAFLSYGGWGGQHEGSPPTVLMTGLAALLGIGAHLLTSLWGLVPDHEDGWTYLPLQLGRRVGASRLLWVATAYVVVVLAAIAWAGATQGLSQPPLS